MQPIKNAIAVLREVNDNGDSARNVLSAMYGAGRIRMSAEEVNDLETEIWRLNSLTSKLFTLSGEFKKIAPKEEPQLVEAAV